MEHTVCVGTIESFVIRYNTAECLNRNLQEELYLWNTL